MAESQAEPPILFVHGNGGSAALWQTTIWRFESNGYHRGALFAIDLPHPTAPSEDSKPEPNRSTTADQKAFLAAAVDRILEASGARKLVLVGSSRGGNAIRNYIRFGGGHEKVSIAILSGTPNHGVYALPLCLDNEFNGLGGFLRSLNESAEVPPGVRFVTLRSDRHDRYAQPTSEVMGPPRRPTGVSYDSPELEGAENIVLAGLDHREVAVHPKAFREIYRAVMGESPLRTEILPEAAPVLDGLVSGYENEAPTNLPLQNARVNVYEVEPGSGKRRGAPRHQVRTDASGRWGPFEACPISFYEIAVAADGYPTLHYYRSPFPRSYFSVNLRLEPLEAFLGGIAVRRNASLVRMMRPRGYFFPGRDRFLLGGKPRDFGESVPGTSVLQDAFDPDLSIPAVLNGEAVVVRTFPLDERHVSIAEFHY